MLLSNVFCINALLTFEFIALIGALFFLAYTNKQELKKWYKYVAGAVTIIIGLIIICTIVNAFCIKGSPECIYKKHHEKIEYKHKLGEAEKGTEEMVVSEEKSVTEEEIITEEIEEDVTTEE